LGKNYQRGDCWQQRPTIEPLLHASLLGLKVDPKISTHPAKVKDGACRSITFISLEKVA
jgi:hypothetical protein